MTHTCFLVIRCDGTARVVTRSPRLRIDEVAYRLRVVVPSAWGRIVPADIELTLCLNHSSFSEI